MKLTCSFSVTSLNGNVVMCNLMDLVSNHVEEVACTVNGTAKEVKHHLGKTVLGVDGSYFLSPTGSDICVVDITHCVNGFTLALWVFIQEPAEYVLFRTQGVGSITLRYNNRFVQFVDLSNVTRTHVL